MDALAGGLSGDGRYIDHSHTGGSMKTMTKSEAAARVRAGLSVETFHHANLGIFNVTRARALIKCQPHLFQKRHFLFADLKAEGQPGLDAAGVVAWLVGQREVDGARCAELTRLQLEEPLLHLYDESGICFLIDGIHRMSERFRRGLRDYWTHLMPLELAPRIPSGIRHQDWGEMEVREGKLVKRDTA